MDFDTSELRHRPNRSIQILIGDLVLDPYALNVIPESLIPTALYILVLVAISWVVANGIWMWLERVAQSDISYSEAGIVKKTI